MTERPSFYLLKKAEALGEALRYFGNAKTTQVIFLGQLDFWEWEIDNLIYSFESFAERAKAWENSSALRRKLAEGRFLLRKKLVRAVHARRPWVRWFDHSPSLVRAPMDLLKMVVCQWNDLLSACEAHLFDPHVEENVALGANFEPNLARYRKAAPELAATAS